MRLETRNNSYCHSDTSDLFTLERYLKFFNY